MTRTEITTKIAGAGYDYYYYSDIAGLIADGCDYDEECQKATDQIATSLDIPTLEEDEDAYENEDYCHINDLVNEQVSAILAED